jgi:hypothetical protein
VWLRQPPQTFEMRDEGLLKLFFAEVLEPAEALEVVRSMRRHREAVNQRLRDLQALKGEGEPDPTCYPLAVLEAGIEFSGWFVDWCHRTEARILTAVPEAKGS